MGDYEDIDVEITKAEHVDYVEEQIGFAVDRYLRRKGWKHTSSTPGCYWLWEKALPDGRVALVSRDIAVRFERNWEADAAAADLDADLDGEGGE